MPVLAGRGSNLAKHTYESKINLAEGGPDFASFAKFGNKIANLATLEDDEDAKFFQGLDLLAGNSNFKLLTIPWLTNVTRCDHM